MTLSELDKFFRDFLKPEEYLSDPSKNGIQISNSSPESKQIKKIGFAVDACVESAKKAVESGCDLLFVHHGFFWGDCKTITGSFYSRISEFIKNDLALYAMHIPLDANIPYGNNFALAQRIGLQNIERFGKWRGMSIGLKGKLSSPCSAQELSQKVLNPDEKPLAILPFGKTLIETVGIISGGAAEDVEDAILEGLDAYITGEPSHEKFHVAKEGKINMICGGHYQTETTGINLVRQKVEKELIEALVYKGKAPIYELVNSNGEIFLKCSGKHRLYDPNMKDYVEVENIESIDALLSTGDIINLKVRKTDAEMPIVDLKVRNNHNYFPNSILSHNTGGEAINYYTSITCRITKTDDIKDATGDVCGIEMRVRNYKNKCSVPFRDANMKLYYDGGFDSNSEYIDFLLLLGMVKQAGAYFKFNHDGQDYSLQGRKKLQEWLDTHADVYDSWKKEIIEKISHHNEILDANNQATDENGNEISLDEAKKMGNAVDVADLASQALAAAAVTD